MAVRQKAIGFKIQNETLEKLEQFCYRKQLKKNAVINLAIEYYLDHV